MEIEQEQSYVIGNRGQYYILLKCTEQMYNRVNDYGIPLTLTPGGAIDLVALSEWLTAHRISHGFRLGQVQDIRLKIALALDIWMCKKEAQELWLSDEEWEQLE